MKRAINSSKRGWYIWLFSLFFLIWFFSVIFAMWSVRAAIGHSPHLSMKQASTIRLIAAFPSTVKNILYSILPRPVLLLDARSKVEKSSWVRRFPAQEDSGYLLFSGLDSTVNHSIISLIRIADGKEMARWDPDWSEILKNISPHKWRDVVNGKNVQASHPILLSDGSIIFKTTNQAMVRINACESKPTWIIGKEVLHHSSEMGLDGTVWSPGVVENSFPENSWLNANLRDDALIRVSIDGAVLEKRSLSKILLDNGLDAMLLGRAGTVFNEDPIHLNQISVAPDDSVYWKRGDLLISARHLSTVFLYRPSNNKIIWYQEGPWMNQHSALFVDDHRISVFDNHVVGGAPVDQPFVSPSDINRVYIYDFSNKQLSQPFASLLAEAKPITMTEGRAQILSDGGLFIEETNFGRHLRFSAEKLMWSRINDYDKQYIGKVSWSRYLTADEVKMPLQSIAANSKCRTT